MMMMATDSPLRSPERTPDQPPPPETVYGLAAAPYRKCEESFSLIFLRGQVYMELDLGLPELQVLHKPGRRAPRGLWLLGGPPLVSFSASIFYIFQKYSP